MSELQDTFWSHVDDLRKALLKVLFTILIGVVISFVFYQPLLNFFVSPLQKIFQHPSGLQEERLEFFRVHNPKQIPTPFTLPAGAEAPIDGGSTVEQIGGKTVLISPGGEFNYVKRFAKITPLVILGPLEGLLTAIKISVCTGCVITAPLWGFVLLGFVLPALRHNEKKLLWPFIIVSGIFIFLGFCFAFFVTIPIANQYLLEFNNTMGTNSWSLSNYLNYTLFLLLANGIAFELGAIGIFAIHLRTLSAPQLIAMRRYAILAAFILGAILTPPDILTQLLLAIPLIILYEGLILYARYTNKSC